MMNAIKRVAGYVRVSTDFQREEGYSIGEQTERIKSYCKAMGWKVVKVYTDGGYSGANTNRPALQGLVEASQRHLIDAVVVYKLDRLSRSQKDTLTLIEGFLSNDVAFISMTESFDTSTPFGRATVGILSCFAQLERENIKERTSIGKEARAKEGKFHGGNMPIGYDYKDGKLVVNPIEAMQIRELHELYQQGESFRSIREIFRKKGYSHKYGQWESYRITKTIQNPLYCGYVKYNDNLYKGEHEPIISEECFERSRLIHDSKKATKQTHLGRSMLGGLLYCARCGAKYGISYTGRYSYYCCYSRRKTSQYMIIDPNCLNKSWRKEKLESLVIGEIAKLKNEPLDHSDQSEVESKIPLIMAEIEKTDSQKSRLMDLYASGLFGMDELESKIRPLNEQKQKLTAELERMQSEPEKRTHALIETFSDAIDCGNDDQIRLLVHDLIKKIELDGEDVTIFWNFS